MTVNIMFDNTHDPLNRLVRREITRAAGVAGTTLQMFTHDPLSRITETFDNNDPSVTDDDVLCTYSYDQLGRVISEARNGKTVETGYNALYKTEQRYPGGDTVTFTHDPAGGLTGVARNGTTAAEYTYTPRRQVSGAHLGNGITLARTYDAAGRVLAHIYTNGSAVVNGFEYGYDPAGNKLYENRTEDPSLSEVYGYDSAYRLTAWSRGTDTQSWELDKLYNWNTTTVNGVTETRTHNEVNELILRQNTASEDLMYDPDGNLIEDSDQTYTWDALNRLVSVHSKASGETSAYTSDAQNRRVTAVCGTSTEIYTYSGWQVVEVSFTAPGNLTPAQERQIQRLERRKEFLQRRIDRLYERLEKVRWEGLRRAIERMIERLQQRIEKINTRIEDILDAGQAAEGLKTFTYGPYIDEPVTMAVNQNGQETVYYYLRNSQYSITAMTDETGAVVETYLYTAYGKPGIFDGSGTELTESAIGNPYMYTGRRWDGDTGMYNFRNRYFHPDMGRFVSRDPIGYWDGMNLYAGWFVPNVTDAFGLREGSNQYVPAFEFKDAQGKLWVIFCIEGEKYVAKNNIKEKGVYDARDYNLYSSLDKLPCEVRKKVEDLICRKPLENPHGIISLIVNVAGVTGGALIGKAIVSGAAIGGPVGMIAAGVVAGVALGYDYVLLSRTVSNKYTTFNNIRIEHLSKIEQAEESGDPNDMIKVLEENPSLWKKVTIDDESLGASERGER